MRTVSAVEYSGCLKKSFSLLGSVMDANKFASEMETWLRDSGRLAELRTKLRADLVMELSRRDQRRPHQSDKRHPWTSALDELFLEYLRCCGRWYTASVFVSEAGLVAAEDKVHRKLANESLTRILSALELPGLVKSDSLRVGYYGQEGEPLVASIIKELRCRRNTKGSGDQLLEILGEVELLLAREESNARISRKLSKMMDRVKKSTRRQSTSGEDELSRSLLEGSEIPNGTRSESSYGRPSASPSPTPTSLPESTPYRPAKKSNHVKALEAKLEESLKEIETMKKSLQSQKEADKVVADQHVEIETLKKEVESLKNRLEPEKNHSNTFNRSADQAAHELIPSAASANAELDYFLSDVRSRVQLLYQSSQSIDNEFH